MRRMCVFFILLLFGTSCYRKFYSVRVNVYDNSSKVLLEDVEIECLNCRKVIDFYVSPIDSACYISDDNQGFRAFTNKNGFLFIRTSIKPNSLFGNYHLILNKEGYETVNYRGKNEDIIYMEKTPD